LGGGIWDWIPEHSETFSEWYPKYPYTIGRAYDYILLNQHSKKNIYEGLNDRNFQDSQYIVSYIFNTEKLDNKDNYKEVRFKRLILFIKK